MMFFSKPKSPVSNKCSRDRSNLEREEASSRAEGVLDVEYSIVLNASAGVTSFETVSELKFNLSKTANVGSVLLDFSGESISYMCVNDKELELKQIEELWKDNRISLLNLLKNDGRNVVKINSKGNYSKDGTGLYCFKEAANEYIYSLLASNHCQKIFPCFDQPDIKAFFSLKVQGPSTWLVVSNEEIHKQYTIGDLGVWEFKPTNRISTYLFAIIMGNYKCVELPKNDRYKNIPLKLYCKASLYELLQYYQKEIFQITLFGIDFYEKIFLTDFPFSKYDQIFCPEFNFLGMENPGAVCLAESYIYSENLTLNKKTSRCLTILHELAHMWFGNLVTMKWWDDIWLNESFAVYISYYCLKYYYDRDAYYDPMIKFFFYKRDGYEEDSLETTHPVSQNITSSNQSSEIFDSITYAKGAAVIKQMIYFIGEENFRTVMQKYFLKFKWKNADMNDFFNIIDSVFSFETLFASEKYTMQNWKNEWICCSSYNEMIPSLNYNDGRLHKILITQKPRTAQHPHLRTHFLKIGVYTKDEAGNLHENSFKVAITGKEQAVIYNGPDVFEGNCGVLLNFDDNGYFKTNLDEQSALFFKKNMFFLNNKLSKAQLLIIYYEMVIDCKISALEFLEISMTWLETEFELQLLDQALQYSSKIIENYLPSKYRQEKSGVMFKLLHQQLVNDKNHDFQRTLVLKEYLGRYAKLHEDINVLLDMLYGRDKELKHIKMSSLLLTQIIELVLTKKLLEPAERAELIQKYVGSNRYYIKFCETAQAELETKHIFWKKFIDPLQDEPLYLVSFSMRGFNNEYDEESQKIFEELFFDHVIDVFENSNKQYAKTFYKKLYPKSDNLEYQKTRLKEILEQGKKIDPHLENLVREKLQFINEKQRVFERIYQGL